MSNTESDAKTPKASSAENPAKEHATSYGGVTDDELEDLFLDFGNEGREAAGGATVVARVPPLRNIGEEDLGADGPPALAEVHLEADDDEPVLEVDVVRAR